MNKVKILHCGDLHLDTPFMELGKELAIKLRGEIITVLRNIVNICNEEEIEILLIAGDFFDNNTVKKETLAFVKNIFKNLKKTKVFISPGNHDPFYYKSFYNIIDWPENVYIFKNGIERIDVDELGVSIHGFAFREKYETKGLMKEIVINEKNINILVGHGDLGNGESEYNPIIKEDIEKSKLDYIALGHIHKFSGVNREGKTFYAYSGCPQGRGFDEIDEKGVLIGEISKGYASMKFRKTSLRQYVRINIDITNIENSFQIESLILNEIEKYNKKLDLFKINLIGYLDEKIFLNLDLMEENLNLSFVKILDKTKIKINDNYNDEDSCRSLFINEIKKLQDEDEEIINLALTIGIKSLMNDEVKLDDY